MARELNVYEASKLADYHGEDDTKLPIILGSRSGNFLRNARSRKEAYEDTEVLWLTGEAKSSFIMGAQGGGKTILTTGIEVQMITAKKRFGEAFAQFDLPHIILDASGEFTHEHFALPLENPRLLARMQPYYKYMPFLKPTSIIEKCVYYTPVPQMAQLAARGIYGDHYIGLKATDLKKIEFQQAFKLVLELLNLEEQDPAARIVRRGCVELTRDNPTFFDIFRTMLEEEKREVKRRKSQSVSRQAQVMLFNALYDGELEIGASPTIKDDLENRKVAVYHFPIQSAGLNTNKVMFTLYLATALDLVRQGSPPFSLYGEEMHKPLVEEPNSVFARKIRDTIQLERKCVAGDTYILLSSGELKKAEEVILANVNSLQVDLKIGSFGATRVIKKEADLLSVKTRHGFEVKATKDHLFLTLEGWKEAQQLKIGEKIAVTRKWVCDELTEEFIFKGKKIDLKIDEDFSYLIGLFIGDGSFSGSEKQSNLGISITNMNASVASSIKKFAKKIDKNVSLYKPEKSKATTYTITQKDLYAFARKFIAPKEEGKPKAETVRLPNPIMNSKKNTLALLKGLYDTDGWMGHHQVLYCTKSKRLAEELQLVLLKFGILSFRRTDKKLYKGEQRTYWVISISDADSIKAFAFLISFRVAFRLKKLNAYLNTTRKWVATREDILQVPTKKVKEYMAEKSIKFLENGKNTKWAQQCSRSYTWGMSRSTLKKLIDTDTSNSEISNYMRTLANSDVLWDRIIVLEEKPKEMVYDFSIPQTQNFIGNGIVLHNTGRLAFFVVRMPEYAKELIDEIDFVFTSQMRADSAKMLEGYVPTPGINFAIEELQIRTTPDGKRDANEWMMLEKGRGYKRFFPIPPLVQP